MNSVAIGLICAAIVSIPEMLRGRVSLDGPALLFAAGAIAALVHRIFDSRGAVSSRAYDGVADLLIHIYARYVEEKPHRWLWRALTTFLLAMSGRFAGIEGAGAEVSQAFALKSRTRTDRWSEQRRRTDVASILAASVSAAFQAPFAAVVLCMELGTGGRTLSAVTSAISAYVGVLFISRKLDLESSWVPFFNTAPQGEFHWWAFPALGLGLGILGWGLIHAFQYFQEALADLFKNIFWLRPVAGALVLFAIMKLYPQSQELPAVEYMNLMTTPREIPQILIYLLSEGLILATVLAAFGTIGIFTPLFSMGGVAGQLLAPGAVGLLTGASGLWAAVLGAPIAGAILVFEMTQSWKLLLAALLTGLVANFVRKSLGVQPLVHRNMQTRGLKLLDGRNAKILETILVRDAMVTDHQLVYENELVKDLMDKFVASKHTFLPVVKRDGRYVGLLTLDIIQEGLESVTKAKGEFFEVKDLLYKTKIKPQTVSESNTLACTGGIFSEHSCVAVTCEGEKVVGLLFAYSVRAAYDREVARRALVRGSEGVVL